MQAERTTDVPGRVAEGTGASADAAVVEASETAPDGWDALTVDVPGGHVLQGRALAEHRRSQGWTPRFARFADGRVALIVTRAQKPLPGFLAYVPRGPVSAGDPPHVVGARAVALADWAKREGATILAVDPELDASREYDAVLARRGFRPTEEIQPSRHRVVLSLPGGASEDEVFGRLSKSTRQRVRAAERAGIGVHDDAAGERLDAFGDLVDATARRKGFGFESERGFRGWWRRVLAAGQARFLVALLDGELLGGLILYRQAGHYATAFSADRAERRDPYPGTMHLLRWRAIADAVRAGMSSIDLGGVDVRGARRQPEPGEPTWGLYQHKLSFGATWVESAAAHEIVLRPVVYRASLAARGLRGLVARGGGR